MSDVVRVKLLKDYARRLNDGRHAVHRAGHFAIVKVPVAIAMLEAGAAVIDESHPIAQAVIDEHFEAKAAEEAAREAAEAEKLEAASAEAAVEAVVADIDNP